MPKIRVTKTTRAICYSFDAISRIIERRLGKRRRELSGRKIRILSIRRRDAIFVASARETSCQTSQEHDSRRKRGQCREKDARSIDSPYYELIGSTAWLVRKTYRCLAHSSTTYVGPRARNSSARTTQFLTVLSIPTGRH